MLRTPFIVSAFAHLGVFQGMFPYLMFCGSQPRLVLAGQLRGADGRRPMNPRLSSESTRLRSRDIIMHLECKVGAIILLI